MSETTEEVVDPADALRKEIDEKRERIADARIDRAKAITDSAKEAELVRLQAESDRLDAEVEAEERAAQQQVDALSTKEMSAIHAVHIAPKEEETIVQKRARIRKASRAKAGQKTDESDSDKSGDDN